MVVFRIPQMAPMGASESAHVEVESWWPDEWGLPEVGQHVSVEDGKVRRVMRVVLLPGAPVTRLLDASSRGRVRIELDAQATR